MNDFAIYFEIGWDHIISADALDHILFMIALAAIFTISDWRKLLVLVTAFTIGHAVTLVLCATDVIRFNTAWVEFLIPLTIVLTAAWNMMSCHKKLQVFKTSYILALAFGLIHGMGFANTIRFMLADAQEIVIPLLGFNLGLEAGQILMVLLLTLVAWIAIFKLRLRKDYWVIMLSLISGGYALYLCYDRWPIKNL